MKHKIHLVSLIKKKYLEYYIMGGHAWRDGYFDSDAVAHSMEDENANPYQLIIDSIKQIINPFPKELPTEMAVKNEQPNTERTEINFPGGTLTSKPSLP